MTAKVLHLLGVPMGERFIKSDWNRDGVWEDAEFDEPIQCVQRMRCVDGEIDTYTPFDNATVNRLRQVIDERNAIHERWGLKNLRVMWFMRSFREWCKPAELSLIRCTREYHEAIESSASWKGKQPYQEAADMGPSLLWVSKMYADHCGPKITVDYADALHDPRGTVNRLAAFCDIPVTDDALTVIDPSQRRFGRQLQEAIP